MNAVEIGPFVFANDRFVAILAIMAFLLAGEIVARWRKADAREIHRWTLIALLGWILGARTGFVVPNWDAFASAPLEIFAIWQGGFDVRAGIATVAVILLAALWRQSRAALPVAVAALVAGAAAMLTDLALPNDLDGRLPDAMFADLSGRPVALATGGPVVLNLWATWCPPCQREMPMMMEVARAQDDARLVFANQGEEATAIAQFLIRADLPDDGILRDPQSALMREFGMPGLPATLFFDAQGNLVAAHTGEISRAELMRRIAELGAGAPQPDEQGETR